jgi:hypothetical protein
MGTVPTTLLLAVSTTERKPRYCVTYARGAIR